MGRQGFLEAESLPHLEHGTPLDTSLPNQKTWGLLAPGLWVPALLSLGDQRGGACQGGKVEGGGWVACLGGGIPEPPKNSQGTRCSTFPK